MDDNQAIIQTNTMRNIIVLSILNLFFVSCKKNKVDNKSVGRNASQNSVRMFEVELNELNNQDISLIDNATELFQKYTSRTSNKNEIDSLFLPYFNIYMSGRDLLKNEGNELVEKYGFIRKSEKGKEYLTPTKSEYLEANIIGHLSQTMQDFCNQQLKEFNDKASLETIANNTLWWERFNKNNPDFFLKEMTKYHYKNWHLKNLLAGTKGAPVFTPEDSISKKALEVYSTILKNSPKTETANTLRIYLDLLKADAMLRTEEITQYINQFE